MLFSKRRNAVDRILYRLFVTELSAKDAERVVEVLRCKGLFPPAGRAGTRTLADFLGEFWDWDRSQYVRERLMHNHGIHRKYVCRCAAAVRNYWVPWFGEDLPLQDVTRAEVQRFILSFLERGSPASAQARNNIIRSGTLALRWAFRNGLIPADITAGLAYYGSDAPDVAILPPPVVAELFRRAWRHRKAQAANKLAMVTGLRSGEIQALRGGDIGRDCIYVRHSWNSMDGLKPPKNGRERTVYVPFPELLDELARLAGGDDRFVFHVRSPYRPMDAKCWLRELRAELLRMGVSRETAARVHFHSWRHYFTAHMRSDGQLEPRLLQRMTGHRTRSMLEYYADHALEQDADRIKSAVRQVFEPFLSRRRGLLYSCS